MEAQHASRHSQNVAGETIYPTPVHFTTPPVAANSFPPPAASYVTRAVFYPYGKGKIPSFTLSLHRTSVPAPNGQPYLAFKLYQHDRPGKDSKAIFEGFELSGDIPATMLAIIAKVASAIPTTQAQIDFGLSHARPLELAAQKRFGWREKAVPLRPSFEAVHRQQGRKHALAIGDVVGTGETRFAARADLEGAIRSHLSQGAPRFAVGGVTGCVYAWYPHGHDVVLQIVTRDASAPMGDSARFRASSPTEADDIAATLIASAEREARSSGRPQAAPSVRPHARAAQWGAERTS